MGSKGVETSRLHLIFLLFLSVFYPYPVQSQCNRNPVIFVFGDSNSDTGGIAAGLGLPIDLPNGRAFFNGSSARFCDGRLVIDFLCESLNTKFLTAYLESLAPNFTNGANFAISGSALLPQFKPYSLLDVQVLQFIRFKKRSLQLISQGSRDLIDDDGFKNALYVIDIGQNNLARAFTYLSYEQVIEKIPSFLDEIKYAISNIYQHGGKNFWIHNTGPLGCLPQKLATTSKSVSGFDQFGCLKSLNDAANQFNEGLRTLCEELRTELKNATIVYVDVYNIKLDLITNSIPYGFENSLMTCCGYGGPPYNYNPNTTCGRIGYNICDEGSKYISWDGVHYTQAANAIVASKILSSNYSTPQLNFDYFCLT